MPADVVYVGTYTRPGGSPGIHLLRFDRPTGALSPVQTIPEYNPTFLAFDPAQRWLFAVSEGNGRDGGFVASFAIDPASGNLTPLSRQPTLGGEPCHLCTDPSGRWLFVANHEHGSVAVLPIDGDGRLSPPSDLQEHTGSGPGPTQKGPHAHQVCFDPPGERLYVADKGIDQVVIYRLDAGASGKLVPNTPPLGRLHAGAAPRHLAFHPNGRFAYVNGEADMTVTTFAYDAQTGALTELQVLSTLPEGVSGENFSTAEIAVHPSGQSVFVSNRGHDSIAIFAVDQTNGMLAARGHAATHGRTPRHFAIDPSGTWMYVGNQDSDTIVQFRIDSGATQLNATGNNTPVPGPACILFSR